MIYQHYNSDLQSMMQTLLSNVRLMQIIPAQQKHC